MSTQKPRGFHVLPLRNLGHQQACVLFYGVSPFYIKSDAGGGLVNVGYLNSGQHRTFPLIEITSMRNHPLYWNMGYTTSRLVELCTSFSRFRYNGSQVDTASFLSLMIRYIKFNKGDRYIPPFVYYKLLQALHSEPSDELIAAIRKQLDLVAEHGVVSRPRMRHLSELDLRYIAKRLGIETTKMTSSVISQVIGCTSSVLSPGAAEEKYDCFRARVLQNGNFRSRDAVCIGLPYQLAHISNPNHYDDVDDDVDDVETQANQEEMEMAQDLYKFTGSKGEELFGHKLAVDSQNRWVMEVRGSGEAMTVNKDDCELVVPYTIRVRDLSAASRVLDFIVPKDAVKEKDILILDSGALVMVTKINTHNRNVTKTLQAQKLTGLVRLPTVDDAEVADDLTSDDDDDDT